MGSLRFGYGGAWLSLALFALPVLAADSFPEPYNSEVMGREGPTAVAAAVTGIVMPSGFSASLIAAEPEVRNPIAMAWDAHGRLWIAENYTYAEARQQFDLTLRDRVVVFEDIDGDGSVDRRTVFTDTLQMLTGIEVGHGGLWVMCPPRLLFIPDRNHDGLPDGPAETILDGFEITGPSYHNFANGLRFGPDGWLYGRCGHSCPARIGRPECADAARLPMEGGIWRYSPRTKRVEVLTTGTTNPWGLDWNDVAEGFFVNTVNGHLWHLIHGAHFAQANGVDPNPLTYELIDQHADHYHFDVDGGWQNSRDGKAADLGGGHAHSGCMIYSGTNWPKEYRGRLLTLNFHGRRANQEILDRLGSGYVARHAADFFLTGDPWFRGIELASGPDGSVVVLDWSDIGECHERDGVHRTSGRLFRIAHEKPHAPAVTTLESVDVTTLRACDLRRFSDFELARLQRHPDRWWVDQSRLVLAERAATAPLDSATVDVLKEHFSEAVGLTAVDPRVSASAHRVRAILSLHVIGGLSHDDLLAYLAHSDEHVRTWAVRLLTEDLPLDAALGPVASDGVDRAAIEHRAMNLLGPFVRLAQRDPSGLVRLALASTLQRLPVGLRPPLASALVARVEDAKDHNLPLLVWYGMIPVADHDPMALAQLAIDCRWPKTRRLIARRLAGLHAVKPEAVDWLLAEAAAATPLDEATLSDVLAGLCEGFAGLKKVVSPHSWSHVRAAVERLPPGVVRTRARHHADELAVLFGDGRAIAAVRDVALDRRAAVEMRRAALTTLIEARPPDLQHVCEILLSDRHLQATAARGLSLFDSPTVARQLIDASRRARGMTRDAIFAALVSRPSFARELLVAVEGKRLSVSDLPAEVVRQMHALGDEDISRRLTVAWGQLRESPQEKRQRMVELSQLVTQSGEAVDLSAGRLLFLRTCGNCHRLYGDGGQQGPDLTGAGRHDLGYLLENMVDPSAVVNRDWRLVIVTLGDGRVLSGVTVDHTDRALTLLTPQERLTIPTDEIEHINQTDRSPMPDGLLDQLTEQQIRDLVAYLRHPTQVPLPE